MYVTITPQKLTGNYSQSVGDFVAYLEKENEGKSIENMEQFFNQFEDNISGHIVTDDIDKNTAKLKRSEPKFYSITINPSKRELQKLSNPSLNLKNYTKELMKEYVNSFNREINGQPISINDIKYYAKIEHERTYKGTDLAIKENDPYYSKIVRLKNEIRQIERGELNGSVSLKQQKIKQLEKQAPHKINGQMILRGMPKQGSQTHIHVIVSRIDSSNKYSLSPGSKYKASEVVFQGKKIKRGFDRDSFFLASEKTFDKMFHFNRNFVESYDARKTLIKNPQKYIATLMGLPINERSIAFKLLGKSGINTSLMNIPTNKIQLVLKAIKKLKKGFDIGIKSSSIGI